MNLTSGVIAAVFAMGLTAVAEGAGGLEIWAVDPLLKVFPDAAPSKGGQALAEVARGEHASLQIVVRSGRAIEGLSAKLAPLELDDGKAILEPRAPRFVGYVPVDRPTQTPPRKQLRKPPADFPDPLLEDAMIAVKPGRAQPIWITVKIPRNAKPGSYRGTMSVTGTIGGKSVSARQALAVKVYKAVVKRSRLWVTNWFSVNSQHMAISPKPESDEYYALLRRFAENMADHRQNVALISPLSLANFSIGADGKLAIDFSRFDRWVKIFIDAGVIGRIEGGHIGGRKSGWESQFVVQTRQIKDGKVLSANADPASPEADRFYARFFPALVKHLGEKAWLDRYTQHLADEPIKSNIKTYRPMAGLARKYAPELRIIEACHTKDLTGSMDVWVPQLNFMHRDFKHYQERQKAGDEIWFYTCVFPQGEYANRYIEQRLIKTRLLHWINYRYGITGYLHWGYNHWTKDSPFTHTTRPHGGPPYLPAGDAWIVYPGKDGPLDSIRHEAMRDGIADHELLCMLGKRDPDLAKRLATKHVLDFHKYNTDVKTFRETRRELLVALSKQ